MARNFFSQGFDTKYVKCISGKLYIRDESASPDTKWYNIQNSDTTITDHVYEGFGVKKAGARAEVTVSGYIN